MSKKLVVIAGPTAVGKTSVAIKLAQHYHTEIISADSRQIFRELEIGTAKPSAAELALVKHHFINTHSISEDYDAGAYGRDALGLIHELFRKYDTLILCGGSGLYIKAVLEGFDDMPDVPEVVREKWIAHYQQYGLPWLREKLREVDPTYYDVVDIQNPHRLIRALELFEVSGQPMHILRAKKKMEHEFEIIRIGLNLDREELYKRIDARMDAMIETGLFEEAERFYQQRELNALQTVGYREIFVFMEGKYDKEEAIRLLKRNSRRYAKRQLTWFTRDEEMHWFKPDQIEEMIQLIEN